MWECLAQAEPPAHADPDILPQETLRKYITYGKQHCKPKLQNADYDKIAAVRSCALRASCMRRVALSNAMHPHSSKNRHLALLEASAVPIIQGHVRKSMQSVCGAAQGWRIP